MLFKFTLKYKILTNNDLQQNIATNTYTNLVDILQHPKFDVKDVVKNIRKFWQHYTLDWE